MRMIKKRPTPVVAKKPRQAKGKKLPRATRGQSRAAASASAESATGLTGFAMDVTESLGSRAFVASSQKAKRSRGFAATAVGSFAALDAVSAALAHLDHALENPAVRALTRPTIDDTDSEFASLGADAQPLTGTTIVKFRQTFHKIPVYGSLVTVELSSTNECLGITSSLGTPNGVAHLATVAPAKAIAVAAKLSGQPAKELLQTPRLYFYYDQQTSAWRLAYVVEDVPVKKRRKGDDGWLDAGRKDYVVDAHRGTLLAELPRTPTMVAVRQFAFDGLKKRRAIQVERVAGKTFALRDSTLNVTTYGFAFRDPGVEEKQLPGVLYCSPPAPWPAEAVSAHANGAAVATFLRRVVKRNNIDNKGGEMISTVNCWDKQESKRPAKEWRNAYWNGVQMVYGQIKFPNGSLFSVANMLDIVGHEMFHGVTDFTSRLEYRAQPGALNESYSDILGVIIANFRKPLARWVWTIGKGFEGPRTVLRDMADPTKHEQPKVMAHFAPSVPPYDEDNDYGEVHTNSGIHNFAAYRIMTAKRGSRYVFTPSELAALFYLALTVFLSRTSQFTDSRRAVVQAAKSLFRTERATTRAMKIKAVEDGFRAAGIV